MRITYIDGKGRRVSKVGAGYVDLPLQDYEVELVTDRARKVTKRSYKKKDVEHDIDGSLPEINIRQENNHE